MYVVWCACISSDGSLVRLQMPGILETIDSFKTWHCIRQRAVVGFEEH